MVLHIAHIIEGVHGNHGWEPAGAGHDAQQLLQALLRLVVVAI